MDRINIEESEKAYLNAAENVAKEKVRFSEEWQIARLRSHSDMAATQISIENTKDALTVAQAAMRIIEWRLNRD